MQRILVVEDEADMRFVLSDNLQAEGYGVEAVGTGKQGIERGLSGDFALVILDLMLPDINGIEVCKKLRAKDQRTPIIILTARGDEIDKVVGLEVGADDYVTKPFGMREFLARIKAVLRRAEQSPAASVTETTIGDMHVDFRRREIRRGDRIETLTRYENDLLQLLAAHRAEPVSRRRILEAVWGADQSSGNRTVDNCIVRLRAKIESDGSPGNIQTVHGVGYRLI
jgi:DNA-binding response OmpR family regulator